MSLDEFHAMEPRLGWKHEYWDQAAQLACQPSAVTNFDLDLTSATPIRLREGLSIRQAGKIDHQPLTQLFLAAFDNAIEFVGWSDEHFRKEAEKLVGRVGEADTRTWVAKTRSGLVGAFHVRSHSPGWLLEPVMVSPNYQRQGVASTLLATAVEELGREGVEALQSRCHLGNPASMAWHAHNAFEERPSHRAANHRWRYYQMLERHHAAHGRHEQAATASKLGNEFRLRAEEQCDAELAR